MRDTLNDRYLFFVFLIDKEIPKPPSHTLQGKTTTHGLVVTLLQNIPSHTPI
jgi:hypothetical protein